MLSIRHYINRLISHSDLKLDLLSSKFFLIFTDHLMKYHVKITAFKIRFQVACLCL